MFRCLGCWTTLWRPRPFCEACEPISAHSALVQIDSLSVWPLYWMVGTSHRVLVGWKKNRGILSDRAILKTSSIDQLIHAAGPLIQSAALVPIPQSYERSLRLRGSPAQDFAHALSRRAHLPVVDALTTSSTTPQAQRSLIERLSAPPKFEAHTPTPPFVVLVDDFVTTGKTLTDAAQTLEKTGSRVLGAFTIGLRPRRTVAPLETTPRLDPMHPTDSEPVHPNY